MQEFIIKPIGYVRNNRKTPDDDHWGEIESVIELTEEISEETLQGIESFSHLEIIYYFDRSKKVVIGSEHPRENPEYRKVGIFAQRKKDRPNHIGATIVNLVKKEGKRLFLRNLDAIDGTPVIDIKPVFKEYLPCNEVIQPDWVHDLMKDYW